MLYRAAAYILGLAVLSAWPAEAQGLAPGRPGPYVIDVRVATVAVPQDTGVFPPLPSGTAVPSRAFGVDLGGHVYLLQLGAARLGIGAAFQRMRGTASPAEPAAGSTSAAPARPDVEATFTSVAPQLSFNFGSSAGWSYLSAGYGRAEIATASSAYGGSGSDTDPEPADSVESGSRASISLGGGARWFLRRRVAFSFDVRFHLVPAGVARGDAAPTPRATLVAASAGMSFR